MSTSLIYHPKIYQPNESHHLQVVFLLLLPVKKDLTNMKVTIRKRKGKKKYFTFSAFNEVFVQNEVA